MRSASSQLALLAVGVLPFAAQASWLTQGGHPFRSGTIPGTLPTPADSPAVLTRGQPAGNNAKLLPPIYIGGDLAGGDGPLVVLADLSCRVFVLDGSTQSGMGEADVLGSYRLPGCDPLAQGGDSLLAPPAVDPSGSRAVVVTAQGRVVAIDVKPSSRTFTRPLWGPFTIPGLTQPLTTSPLVSSASVWISGPQVDGLVYRFDLNTGANLTVPSQPCFANPSDIVIAPITQLTGSINPPVGPNPVLPNTYVAVTSGGCLFEITETGQVNWRIQPTSTSYQSVMPVVLPPAVDVPGKRVYFTSPDGYFCCATTSGVWPCPSWPDTCVQIEMTAVNATLVGGLSVSPQTMEFHEGQIFVWDNTGVLWVVFAADGVVITSAGRMIDGAAAAPILMPAAMGPGANILVVVSTDADLYTTYVGDETNADDDSADDDDGVGSDGFSWGISLQPTDPSPSPTPSIIPSLGPTAAKKDRTSRRAHRGLSGAAPLVANTSFAVTDDGRILIPLSDGSLVVVGAKTTPPNGVPMKTIIAVSTTVGLLVVLALGLTLFFACRHRCRKRAQTALADQGAEGGGSGGVGNAHTGLLAGDISSDIDPFLLAGMEEDDGGMTLDGDPASFGGISNNSGGTRGGAGLPLAFAPVAAATGADGVALYSPPGQYYAAQGGDGSINR